MKTTINRNTRTVTDSDCKSVIGEKVTNWRVNTLGPGYIIFFDDPNVGILRTDDIEWTH